jgi:hypothetical protein
MVKLRDPSTKRLVTEDTAKLESYKGEMHIKCKRLCDFLLSARLKGRTVAFFFEGTENDARCIVELWEPEFLELLDAENPSLRLACSISQIILRAQGIQ